MEWTYLPIEPPVRTEAVEFVDGVATIEQPRDFAIDRIPFRRLVQCSFDGKDACDTDWVPHGFRQPVLLIDLHAKPAQAPKPADLGGLRTRLEALRSEVSRSELREVEVWLSSLDAGRARDVPSADLMDALAIVAMRRDVGECVLDKAVLFRLMAESRAPESATEFVRLMVALTHVPRRGGYGRNYENVLDHKWLLRDFVAPSMSHWETGRSWSLTNAFGPIESDQIVKLLERRQDSALRQEAVLIVARCC